MGSSPVTYTPRAPAHVPSRREWAGFSISLLLIVLVAYGTDAYLSYREETAASRLPAVRQLEARQEAVPGGFGAASRLRLDRDPKLETYRVGVPGESGDPPFVLLCATTCADPAHRVRMELAYGLHYDRSAGADNWDFWFAPVAEGRWVADPVRLLYRVNPSQSESWGLLDESWTGGDVSITENAVGDLKELADTTLAAYLQRIVDDRDVVAANRIGAPPASLTIHSSFADRALLVTPPFWRPVGEAVENARSGLPDFISEASSGKTLVEWLGDNWDGLLWLCTLLFLASLYAIKGWRAVSIYGYNRLLDEMEAVRREREREAKAR